MQPELSIFRPNWPYTMYHSKRLIAVEAAAVVVAVASV